MLCLKVHFLDIDVYFSTKVKFQQNIAKFKREVSVGFNVFFKNRQKILKIFLINRTENDLEDTSIAVSCL